MANGVMGGIERVMERLSGDLGGLGLVETVGAYLCGNAGLEALKRRAGRLPIICRSQTGKFFEKRMDCGAEGTGEQAAFVAREFVVSHPFRKRMRKGWGTQDL